MYNTESHTPNDAAVMSQCLAIQAKIQTSSIATFCICDNPDADNSAKLFAVHLVLQETADQLGELIQILDDRGKQA